ncbi:helix-turn-helix transcriptional regulator [Paenibacillus sp. IB182496]|uniref:Helix-turn-helix transcriptional regulator n=1 Tax=Paenibacillus sabuli TaxID=2772509 RepID=A0A927BR53_9BACL|nr:AraC family transcriptional regulator [Paenibacillus sabuli]MBD2844024.1 helix-turn-helix transcriptional regulator [Paenibacillus sabuli]
MDTVHDTHDTSEWPYATLVPTLHHIVDRRAHRSWRVPSGVRAFHNLLLIAGGEGIAWTNGVATPLERGMLVYHPAREAFGYESSRTQYLHVLGGNFSLAALSPGSEPPQCASVPALPLPTFSRPAGFERLLRLFRELHLAWGTGAESGMLRSRGLFMLLLDELRPLTLPGSATPRTRERVQEAAAYMETHYMRKLSLETVAAVAGLSPSYFGQLFRRQTGTTPVDFLHDIRLHQATLLLQQGCSVADAAAQTGYGNAFYFSRVFKKKKGLSPSEYMQLAHQ